LLTQLAHSNPETSDLPRKCTGNYEKGLLEWQLSIGRAVDFFAKLPPDRFCELSYAELLSDPAPTIAAALKFIGLAMDPAVGKFVREQIRRKSAPLAGKAPTQVEIELGGPLLELSLQHPAGEGITARAVKARMGRASGFSKHSGGVS